LPALLKKKDEPITLWRENQRISLRAFLRTLLHNPQIAQTKAMEEFLTREPITPTDADVDDIMRRKAVDAQRMEEQKQFYEIARKRAAELDIYMEEWVTLHHAQLMANQLIFFRLGSVGK
jgi:predicted esterase YcpF (UPF0227 family)